MMRTINDRIMYTFRSHHSIYVSGAYHSTYYVCVCARARITSEHSQFTIHYKMSNFIN